MSIVWPVTLPQTPETDSWDETIADNTIRNQPDFGAPLTRARSTFPIDTVSCRFYLEDSDSRDDLVEFYRDTLSGGVLSFEWQHPVDGNTYEWKFAESPRIPSAGGVAFFAYCKFIRVSRAL